MSLGAVPMPAAPVDPMEQERQQLALEEAARMYLRRHLGLEIEGRAPTWRDLLFGGGRIEFRVPQIPPESLALLDKDPVAPPAGPDQKLGAKLLADLKDARPRGMTPRSISPRVPRPPARDALAAWMRRVFLVAAGPESVRLLVAAGYLTPGDVDTIEGIYPGGLDVERRTMVQAAGALTVAAARNGSDPDLQPWLNEQLLTLMDEHRPTEFFEQLYAREEKQGGDQGQGPGVGAPPSQVVNQTRPATAPEGR